MAIEVNNVTKHYGDFMALDDVSVDVPDGSLTALLSASQSIGVDGRSGSTTRAAPASSSASRSSAGLNNSVEKRCRPERAYSSEA